MANLNVCFALGGCHSLESSLDGCFRPNGLASVMWTVSLGPWTSHGIDADHPHSVLPFLFAAALLGGRK